MDALNALDFIYKVIRVRKHILALPVSQKNKAKCISIIKTIEKTTNAFHHKWKNDAWIRFLIRKRKEIIYLIPSHNQESYLVELKQIINGK